jgi:hypothetical protein
VVQGGGARKSPVGRSAAVVRFVPIPFSIAARLNRWCNIRN